MAGHFTGRAVFSPEEPINHCPWNKIDPKGHFRTKMFLNHPPACRKSIVGNGTDREKMERSLPGYVKPPGARFRTSFPAWPGKARRALIKPIRCPAPGRIRTVPLQFPVILEYQ